MSEFTPSTETVKRYYFRMSHDGLTSDSAINAEFDRWLAQRDAQTLRNAGTSITRGHSPDNDLSIFNRWDIQEWLEDRANQIEAGDHYD